MLKLTKHWTLGFLLAAACGDDGSDSSDGETDDTGTDTADGDETGTADGNTSDDGSDGTADDDATDSEDDTTGDGDETDDDTTTDTGDGPTDTGDDDTDTTDTDDTDTGDTGDTGDTDTDTDTGDTGTDTDTDTGECPYTPVSGDPEVTLEEVAGGFNRPVLALGHPTEPGRLFVVEQGGSIKHLAPGEDTAPEEDFLTLDVNDGPQEAGLLGMALHPDFPADPRFYVNYNPQAGMLRTRIEEFRLDPNNSEVADPESGRILMEINQPAINHNGGMIAFGPDGMLYIGTGDGGGGCDDAAGSSRDRQDFLAKILRIDVEPNGNDPYTVPTDNPFVADVNFAPEIYAWGFRNPWRFSFDSETGRLFVADVGQDDWEEVDVVEAGHDYGWNVMEGMHCSADTDCMGADCDDSVGPGETNSAGMTLPIVEYENSGPENAVRCSITGGSVYRSCEVPAWSGRYFYSDYCTGEVFAVEWDGTTATDLGVVYDAPQNITGNGWNMYGDVYFTGTTSMISTSGNVYRLAPAP